MVRQGWMGGWVDTRARRKRKLQAPDRGLRSRAPRALTLGALVMDPTETYASLAEAKGGWVGGVRLG